MFERYDESARRAVFFARYEASQTGSPYIETLHLLLGVLRQSGAVLRRIKPGFSVDDLMESCRRLIPQGKKSSTSVDLPISQECQHAFGSAAEHAEVLGSEVIRPVHLIMGLISASEDVASLLSSYGITAETLRPLKPGETATASASAVPASRSRAALIEFICSGERIASTPANGLVPIPLADEEIVFTREAQTEIYKVLSVCHHYEGFSGSETQSHCWLEKVVVEVERVTGE